MSSNDSFIDEVSEEVRRDRLFASMRRYGWIAVLAVLALVGAASWSEWSKAQTIARAEALGDALLGALEPATAEDRAAALAAVPATGEARAVTALLTASEQETSGDIAAAVATLTGVAEDAGIPVTYRELAQLKALMIGGGVIDPAERRAGFEAMAVPGRTYRTVALEQLALMTLADGDSVGAIAALETLIEDAEASEGLRERARGLIVALSADEAVAAAAGAAPVDREDTAPATVPGADATEPAEPVAPDVPAPGTDAAATVGE